MSYSSSSATGRLEASVTNTSFKLRRLTEFKQVEAPPGPNGYVYRYGQLIGECGHVVETVGYYQTWYVDVIARGKKKRCPHCPIPPRVELPENERCDYDQENEFGIVRRCNTRARFLSAEVGLSAEVAESRREHGVPESSPTKLCRKHHDHLAREGYLASPAILIAANGSVRPGP